MVEKKWNQNTSEAWKLKENEKKLKEKSKKAELEAEKNQIKFKEKKEKIEISETTWELLLELEELVVEWVITADTAKKINAWEVLTKDEINDMFEKIKQIENIKNIEDYIPKNLIVSKQEYTKAINDKEERKNVLKKLNNTLSIVADNITGTPVPAINIFANFIELLDKNLILIQENTIDLKNTLEKVDKHANKS